MWTRIGVSIMLGPEVAPPRDICVVGTAPTASDQMVASDTQPRLDYLEIAHKLRARIIDAPPSAGITGRLLSKLPGRWDYAWSVRSEPALGFLSLAEEVGIPLALLKPSAVRHVVIAHNLTTLRKRAFAQSSGWLRRTNSIVVVSRRQEDYLRREARLPEERVRFVFDKVDHLFFAPRGEGGEGDFVLSVGAAGRDYETLVEALRRLGVRGVLVPSSLWFTGVKTNELPPNVTVRRNIPFTELRTLYEQAALVVVPLQSGTEYAAGVNAVLEAMAMRKPLIVTDTPGLGGYLDDGVTMRTVPGGNVDRLAAAIDGLLTDADEGRRLGANARAVVEGGRNLDTYVTAIVDTVTHVIEHDQGS